MEANPSTLSPLTSIRPSLPPLPVLAPLAPVNGLGSAEAPQWVQAEPDHQTHFDALLAKFQLLVILMALIDTHKRVILYAAK